MTEFLELYQRFREHVDLDDDEVTAKEVRERADEFFKDSAGATSARKDALVRGSMEDIAMDLERDYGIQDARATSGGVVFRDAEGEFRDVEGVRERVVDAPEGWPTDKMKQAYEPTDGTIISQKPFEGGGEA